MFASILLSHTTTFAVFTLLQHHSQYYAAALVTTSKYQKVSTSCLGSTLAQQSSSVIICAAVANAHAGTGANNFSLSLLENGTVVCKNEEDMKKNIAAVDNVKNSSSNASSEGCFFSQVFTKINNLNDVNSTHKMEEERNATTTTTTTTTTTFLAIRATSSSRYHESVFGPGQKSPRNVKQAYLIRQQQNIYTYLMQI